MSAAFPDGNFPETVALRDGEWVCICCSEPAPFLTPEMMAPAVSVGSAHVHTTISHRADCAILYARGGWTDASTRHP